MEIMISPTFNPDLSAGVLASTAETTTGLEPWILNPNSPLCFRRKSMSLSHAGKISNIDNSE